MRVILFDGVCNFCNASINFVIDRDPHQQFVFAPLQSNTARQLLEEKQYDPDQFDSVVLLKNGRLYEKSDAALEIARDLTGAWPLLYAFKIVPLFIRNAVYDLIARNRYKWFGRQDACRIPTQELRQRFLG